MFNGDGEGTPYAMRTWGVIFVEVGVDPDFGILRLRRAVGVYSAGPHRQRAHGAGADDRRDHLGLGQGDDGGERPGAGVQRLRTLLRARPPMHPHQLALPALRLR